MFVSNIIQIQDVIIREEVIKTPFSCDLMRCKGACCTLKSEYGAPLNENEIEIIGGILDKVKEYLPEQHLLEIENNGFYDIKEGEFLTKSVDDRACVFVYYENDVAKCSLEKAYLEGKTNFRKPISCHLFPIRVSDFGGDLLRFEKFNECEPAIEKGEVKKISTLEFCEEPLTRLYGKEWYSNLKETIGK
jgi:hypothetical protein